MMHNIIDEPALAGVDVETSQGWLDELLKLDQDSLEVQEAVLRARRLLDEAESLPRP